MDAIKAMYDNYTNTNVENTTTPPQEGDVTLTSEKITEMIDSAAEQFKNSTLNNKTEIESLKESIDALTEKVNDISAKLESKSSDNIDTNTPNTPNESE